MKRIVVTLLLAIFLAGCASDQGQPYSQEGECQIISQGWGAKYTNCFEYYR